MSRIPGVRSASMLDLSFAPRLAELRLEQTRRRCTSYHGFLTEFWSVVEPATPFVDGWHIHSVAEHLEACARRQIRKLIINIPPRCGKSIEVSVMLCPYIWGAFGSPQERFLYASYSGGLSARDSRQARKVIASAKYQELYRDAFSIRKEDKDTEAKFENDKSGYRISTSVGGATTGEGGSIRVLDDPHKADEAQSEAIRGSVIEWMKLAFSTRLNDPKTDIEILVMQRLHEGDATGYLLSEIGGHEHLCIPMEWDKVPRKTFLGSYDPRKTEDELLWPDRFPMSEVKILKKMLGSFGTSGQLQQSPAPEEGGIIKVASIRLWPSEAKLPIFEFVLQSYDTAFSKETTSDYTVMLAIGIFEHKGVMKAMIIDAWREKMEYPELRRRSIEEMKSYYGEEDGGQHGVDCVLVEKKGSGQSLLQDLNRAGLPARPYDPGRADKIMRAHRIAPLVEAGLLYVMESPNTPDKPVSWMKDSMNEWKLFPNAKNDDFTDALTQALIYLQDSKLITIDAEEEDLLEDWEKRGKNVSNPYATFGKREYR